MLNEPNIPFIDVPVRPVTIGGVEFQRVTRCIDHYPYRNPETGEFRLTVTVLVMHYLTNADGSRGAYAGALVPAYPMTYAADNTEAIDTATGEIVSTLQFASQREAWLQSLRDDPRPLMLRGTAFLASMHAGPVDIVPQLIQAMQAADGPPWYRFGGRPDNYELAHPVAPVAQPA